MRQIVGTVLLVGIVSGCVNVDGGPETGGARPNWGRSFGPPAVPGVEGPYGTPVSMAAPYNTAPPGSPWAAQQMMRNSVPLNSVQMNPPGSPMSNPLGGGMPPTPVPPGGIMTPPGLPFGPGAPSGNPYPPKGPMGPMGPGMGPMGPMGPGMGPMGPMGPGMGPMGPTGPTMGPRGPMSQMGPMGGPPFGNISQAGFQGMPPNGGVMQANVPPGSNMPEEVMQAQFGGTSPVGALFPAQRTQVFFSRPAGMKISWYTQGKDGKPSYSLFPLETPGRYNFAQGAIYRLKLTHIKDRPGVELYPTLEVVPTSPKTNEFLAHNSVPLEFTDEDFKQVIDRNYIVKVIYLPDPQFQDVAGAGPDEIVSTRLEPGQDPIQEALRRGSILLVLRIGNIDQEVPGSPSLSSPVGGGAMPGIGMPPPGMGMPPSFQVPYFGAQPFNPGMMPLAPGMLPQMPPGALPPVPGRELEQKNPNPRPQPLPPLPNEQFNKLNPVLPFAQPGDLVKPQPKDPNVGVKPDVKLELPAPKKLDEKQVDPMAPLPQLNLVLPMPLEENKTPPKQGTNPVPLPLVAPNKVDVALPKMEASPPVVQPKTIPGIPVNNPKEAGNSSLMPMIPMPPLPVLPQTEANQSGPPNAPPAAISTKVENTKDPVPVVPNAKAGPSSSGLPGLPALPSLSVDMMNSPDLVPIPLAPLPEKK